MVKFDKHIFLNSISEFKISEELSSENLDGLLTKYPAFSSLQLINAVLTNKNNPELFEKNLSEIATKVIDRSILHDYIYKNKFSFEVPIKEEKEVDLLGTTDQKVSEKIFPLKTIEEEILLKKLTEENLIVEKEQKIDIPTIEKLEILEPPKIEIKEPIKEEVLEENKDLDKSKSSKEGRDLAFKNLSDDLFKDKIGSNNEPTSEKDRKRIEAMKKLQEELFNSPVEKKAKPKKAPIVKLENESVKKPVQPIVKETVLEKPIKAVEKHLTINKKIEPVQKKEKKPLTQKKVKPVLKTKTTTSPLIEKSIISKPVKENKVERIVKIEKEPIKTTAKKLSNEPTTKEPILSLEKRFLANIDKLLSDKKRIVIEGAPKTAFEKILEQKEVISDLEKAKRLTLLKENQEQSIKENLKKDISKSLENTSSQTIEKRFVENIDKLSTEKKEIIVREANPPVERIYIPTEALIDIELTKKLTPMEKFRLAKKLKEKDTSEGKKEHIANLKIKKAETVIIEKNEPSIIDATEGKQETTEKGDKKEGDRQKELQLEKLNTLKAKIKTGKLKEAKEKLKNENPITASIDSKQKASSIKEEKEEEKEEKNAAIASITKTAPITKKPLSIKDFIKDSSKEQKITEKKNILISATPTAKDSNFLKWLKVPKVLESETLENATKPLEKALPKQIIEEVQITEKEEEITELIPFEKSSGIEHEMHQEIKKSTDPLDEFINNQIAKKKGVRTKNTDKTLSNIGLISQTLAEILVIQQKYTEAIEVYNTLSLKYPEKSIYFAHQIEKIKNY